MALWVKTNYIGWQIFLKQFIQEKILNIRRVIFDILYKEYKREKVT